MLFLLLNSIQSPKFCIILLKKSLTTIDLRDPPELVFSPHFLKIVVEVKASGLPHVLELVGGKQGHASCKILLLNRASFGVIRI